MRARTALLVVTGIVAAAACAADFRATGPVDDPAPAERIDIDAGHYFGLAWPRDDLIVTSLDLSPPTRWELVAFGPDGSDFRVIPLARVDGCDRTTYRFPSTVRGGRIVMDRECDAPRGVVPVARSAVVLVDPDTAETTLLSDIGSDFHPRGSSWNPDLTRGIAAQSSRICASMAWLTTDGVEDMELTLGSGDSSWRVDEELRSDDCLGGRADWPAWSPDGRSIAFFASPASIGVEGGRRLDKPWHLYVMGGRGTDPKAIVKGVEHARGTTWSPDSRRIAYSAEEHGVFIASTSGGRPRKVSSLGASWLAWSPDGTRLAMLVPDAGSPIEQQREHLHLLQLGRD